MIRFVFYFLVFFPFYLANAQQPDPKSCLADSTEYKILQAQFDTIPLYGLPDAIMRFGTLSQYNRDCFCELLVFAKIFNHLLEIGLDLKYDKRKNPPEKTSIVIVRPTKEELDWIQNIKKNNDKYIVFQRFILFKEHYERYTLPKYKKDPARSLVKDVNNIILYGTYQYPNNLKDILLSKYSYITRE